MRLEHHKKEEGGGAEEGLGFEYSSRWIMENNNTKCAQNVAFFVSAVF